MTKPKKIKKWQNSKCYNTENVTQPKNSKCNKTQKLKMWQSLKKKLSNFEKTQQLKLGQLKDSNCDKTKTIK